MAQSIHFPEASDTAFSKTRSNVGGLPIKESPKSSTSCWQLSPEELEEVRRTGVIWVTTDTFDKLDQAPDGDRWQPAIRVSADKAAALDGW